MSKAEPIPPNITDSAPSAEKNPVRQLRESLHLSGKQFAMELGCCQETVIRIEKGQKSLTQGFADRIFEKYGVRIQPYHVKQKQLERSDGLLLYNLRKSLKMTQKELSNALGLNKDTIIKMEKGYARITDKTVQKIKEIYGVEIRPKEEKPPEKNPLRRLRLSLNMTQTEFAERLGLCREFVCSIETGRMELTPRVAERVNEIFGVEMPVIRKAPAGEYLQSIRQLRRLRESLGLTYKEFGDPLNIGVNWLREVEHGWQPVTEKLSEKIRIVYGETIPPSKPDFKEEKEIGMESVFIVKEEPDIPDANKAIRRLRASLHMSRKQFAESLNYESSQVVRIEYGVAGVSGRMRRQIKAVYGIDLPQNVPTENTKRKRKDEDYEVPDGEQNRRGNA